jgi:formylglycine-generating enzyme required for sulfatase activity
LVEVGDLCIDRTEVTAKAYLSCVSAGRCTRDAKKKGCWADGVTDPRTGTDLLVPSTADNPATLSHPINCVTWKEAEAYCAFVSKRLPTEAEWVWAARGGSLARRHAWGDEAPAGHACWNRARKGTCAAGSFSGDRTAHGILDMGGNVSEDPTAKPAITSGAS